MVPILFLGLFLGGCSNKITSTEAEDIAIQTALDEGYSNPQLYVDFDTKTIEKFHYSKHENKDVKVWEVNLVTDERLQEMGTPPDLIYYINIEKGEVVHKISGID